MQPSNVQLKDAHAVLSILKDMFNIVQLIYPLKSQLYSLTELFKLNKYNK